MAGLESRSASMLPSSIHPTPRPGQMGQSSGFGAALASIVAFIPGALFWIITFTTITLPTWLFTLFSMSLTFTMNFTTL